MTDFKRPSEHLPSPQTPHTPQTQVAVPASRDISELQTGLLGPLPVERAEAETALLHPVPPTVAAIRTRAYSGELPSPAAEETVRAHLREAAALRERAATVQANIQRQASLIQRDMVQRDHLQRAPLTPETRALLQQLDDILPRHLQHLDAMRKTVHAYLAEARTHEEAAARVCAPFLRL